MRKLELFITTFYLQGHFLINEAGQGFYQVDYVTFSKMYSGQYILGCPFAKFVTSKSQLFGLFKC